jgi:hypothetical protein
MKWYNFIACFFCGVFLVNFIPHFIQGISGNYFPTPFAKPPGKGLSSPQLNVVWGLTNMVACLLLYNSSGTVWSNKWSVILFVLGFVVMSVRLSYALAKKDKNIIE